MYLSGKIPLPPPCMMEAELERRRVQLHPLHPPKRLPLGSLPSKEVSKCLARTRCD